MNPMHHRFLAIAILGLLSSTVSHAGSDEVASFEAYFAQMQMAGPQAVITYCVKEVPELTKELEVEYQRFSEKVRLAMEPLRERIRQHASEPAPRDAMQQFSEIGPMMVEAARRFPAQNYCPWLLGRLQATTSDSLRAKVEAEYARYEALKTQKESQAK